MWHSTALGFLGGIDKIIGVPYLSDAAALEKGMAFKIRGIRNALGRCFQRQHIIAEHGGICPQRPGLLQQCLSRFSGADKNS